MVDRSSPETASEKLAAKFENCDHAAFYFDAGKDELMRREVLDGDEHDLIVAALRSFRFAQRQQQTEIDRLHEMLENREEFIANKGLWKEFSAYLAEPHAPRVPKVRTSHHRNKEEAARLQELVNQRFAVADTSTDRPPQAWLDAKAEIDAGWPDPSPLGGSK